MAHFWCKGEGLEIGSAAHNPFRLTGSRNVAPFSEDPTHPDHIDFHHYKQAQIDQCGKYDEIDIIGEANNIPVAAASQDYIISSHSIEHLPNPIGAFLHWNTLLRPGAIIFMILPHRDAHIPDRDRPVSTVREIIRAYEDNYDVDTFPYSGSESGRRGHYFVWTLERFLEVIDWANTKLKLDWRIEATLPVDDKVGNGFTVVARFLGGVRAEVGLSLDSKNDPYILSRTYPELFPNLWAQPRHPYYIFCPDYRENSAGVFALHMLCHALNQLGLEAYVTAESRNPRLRTPRLTTEIEEGHQKAGNVPITVYPEVVSGNPRNEPIVVRYLLNKAGYLAGDETFPESEILFTFSSEFLSPGIQAEILMVPLFDLTVFNAENTDSSARHGNYYYAHRYLERGGVLSDCTKNATELSHKNPRTLLQLATIFRSAERLYSYESSAICTEAMLCGCPVVYLPSDNLTAFPSEHLIGHNGAAWGDSDEEIERAKSTVKIVFEKIEQLQNKFWSQLDKFIDITQKTADAYHSREAEITPVTANQNSEPELRVAFLLESGMPKLDRNNILLAFLQAFEPGESVALIIPVDSMVEGAGAIEAEQQNVMEQVMALGVESFPDIVILEIETELKEILSIFSRVHRIRFCGDTSDLQECTISKRLALSMISVQSN